jgi:hypothetical protein
MSLTKESAGYAAAMEAARMRDENDWDEYMSHQYFHNTLKGRMPVDDETINQPKGTTQTNQCQPLSKHQRATSLRTQKGRSSP